MIVNTYSYANYYKNNNNQQNLRKINNAHADKVSFGGNNLTKAQRTELAAQLSEKMKNRPESVQKMYQCGIDFVNNKLSKADFLMQMHELLRNGEFETLTEDEQLYLGNYGVFFNLKGPDPNYITISDIIDCFENLF